MKELLKEAKKIKSLEIQGASNVATSAIQFLSDYAHRVGKNLTPKELYEKLIEAREVLVQTRVTEPALRNGLNFILNKVEKNVSTHSINEILEIISKGNEEFKFVIKNAKQKIAEIGARRIPDVTIDNEFCIMTHCHSSVVNAILLEAKQQGKDNFKVIATETRPFYQGRKTVKKLLDAGIEVIHVVDSAMRWAVNHHEVDLILIGADSITSEGTIINNLFWYFRKD